MQRLAAANRVSIRAVLDDGHGDLQAALRDAGIFEPVAIPVLLGDQADASGGMLGNGVTPNVVGVLEPDEAESDTFAADPDPAPLLPKGGAAIVADRSGSANLPASFGIRPLAPVRAPGR